MKRVPVLSNSAACLAFSVGMRCAAVGASVAVAAAVWLLPASARAHQSTPAGANAIQRENRLAGDPGWAVPADAGAVIAGYSSQTSVEPGQNFALHVRAPLGSRYRTKLFRLGWYGGAGGRLVGCVPGCGSSRAAVPQPASSAPNSGSGLIRTSWHATDLVPIPPGSVSGYYEAKLEVVSGPYAGSVGRIPLVVRERRPRAAVLVEVPVNTWQAYDSWGGRSLYAGRAQRATKVSFNRPYAEDVAVPVVFKLELQQVRYLERTGVDVSYQTDVDTDRAPGSLLAHRLVLSIGHDEYWTQRMRTGFDHALALGTNLAFGANAGMWRIRYEDDRRTVVEWRSLRADPVHDPRYATGEFRFRAEPECRLMATQYENYAHRPADLPATAFTIVGTASDPWLSAAGLGPGDVVGGVVGYEWDSLIKGCFAGRVVRLMHADAPGIDGVSRSADAVRATAPSGARVFAMGTLELGWALDDFGGHRPDRRVQRLMTAALADLTRPAPPARLIIQSSPSGPRLIARLRAPDPRIQRVSISRPGVAGVEVCADALHRACLLRSAPSGVRYAAVAIDRWSRSEPLLSIPSR